MSETILHLDKHVLLCFDTPVDETLISEYNALQLSFCGRVFHDDNIPWEAIAQDATIYFCGDLSKLSKKTANYIGLRLRVVKELAYNQCESDTSQFIGIGQIPVNQHNVAVYFRGVLGPEIDYFDTIRSEHTFQSLTESNKPDQSFRKGIYLSKVYNAGEETRFNLLRCSTNLGGPTLNLASTDKEILKLANNLAKQHFSHPAAFNHVLAQVYENTTVKSGHTFKERKARIKSHADKTKDMPRNGMIAFCTIYSSDVYNHDRSPTDLFDYQHKKISVLTRLRFKLKESVQDKTLTSQFTVLLYPNSILIIPLSTNRLYTHEIVPPPLEIANIPTRLGYVIRCSDTEAVFKHGKTFIMREGVEVEMDKPNEDDIASLKTLYYRENTTDELVSYNDINFSLNNGDYMKPME
ncbi:hypothetical protein V493_05600 [Pseudogymnoascus sp. VKM F-4281 (FW-2241)]|nr:hypothetical protein V493_05600 [Pseudogymnoascus sp. VKM F-4281 (FW-2241)]